jgi:hypothetical protein
VMASASGKTSGGRHVAVTGMRSPRFFPGYAAIGPFGLRNHGPGLD